MAECSNCGSEAAAEALGVKSPKDESQCSKYKMRKWDNIILNGVKFVFCSLRRIFFSC